MQLIRMTTIAFCASLFLAPVLADPFVLRYDASEVYPEDAGWARRTDDPAGLEQRILDNGILTLDGTASPQIADVYEVHDPALTLRPGERLVLTWRMRTLVNTFDADNHSDVAVYIATPFYTGVELYLGTDRIAYNGDVANPDAETVSFFSEFEYHTFGLRSEDYQNFSLTVDGIPAFSGIFSEGGVVVPRVAFGDSTFGFSSLSEWDFVEVAVVPESSSAVMGLAVCGLLIRRRASKCS